MSLVKKLGCVLVCLAGLNAPGAVAAPPLESAPQAESTTANAGVDKPAAKEPDPAQVKALLQLKKEIRQHLAKMGKVNPLSSKVSLETPHDFWGCANYYRDHNDTPTRVYAAMSRDLAIADRLLTAENPVVRRSALGIACSIITHSNLRFKDFKLSVAVADAYLLPNLDMADTRRDQFLSQNSLLWKMIVAYSKGNELAKLQHAAELALEDANSLNSQDACRLQIAVALQRQKKYDEAIVRLKEVTDSALVNGAKEFISTLEKERDKAKAAPQK